MLLRSIDLHGGDMPVMFKVLSSGGGSWDWREALENPVGYVGGKYRVEPPTPRRSSRRFATKEEAIADAKKALGSDAELI